MGNLVSMKLRRNEADRLTSTAQFCGHATVIIVSENGKRLIIDPWLRGNPRCPEKLHNPEKFDAIVLTHGHSDHTASALELAKRDKALVFATFELANLLIKEGIPEAQVQPMNKGGTVALPESGGVMVTLTHAYHSSSFDASDGKTYYAGEACGAIITLESGQNIYHAGDTALFGDMRLIHEVYRPEIAFMPIGDRFTMGPLEAAKAVKLVQPDVFVPMHYGTFDVLTGHPEDLRLALGEFSSRMVVMQPGEEYEF